MQKFLVIQTAFIGDVVLSTAIAEKLAKYFPGAQIDYLVRKGNEKLLRHNPYIFEVITWDKKKNKKKNLLKILSQVRKTRYDKVINLQRYFSTGFLTAFSGAKEKVGFKSNPLSFLFDRKIIHTMGNGRHEVERNNDLIEHFTDKEFTRPRIYPSAGDHETIKGLLGYKFVTMTPSSVWFTKKYPEEKWVELMDSIDPEMNIYLLGGPDNVQECIRLASVSTHPGITVLAGKLGFLQSAALMRHAVMNYTNDSAPLHFASAVNAPVTAIFCSTIPGFGYTPLSDRSFIIETRQPVDCRPCGTHGYKKCPLGHFNCARTIQNQQLLETLYADRP